MMDRRPLAEAKLLSAPRDGVAPALLLTIHSGKPHTTPTQYLINVPEGFARLVLEHRCRPGPGLRALLLTDLSQSAQGGLAGLVLRLRQDGHSSLRLLGPAGLHDTVDGLSYFVRWTHPSLELTALTSAQQGVVYDDDCVEVRALWSSCLLWQVPGWLASRDAAAAATATATPANAPTCDAGSGLPTATATKSAVTCGGKGRRSGHRANRAMLVAVSGKGNGFAGSAAAPGRSSRAAEQQGSGAGGGQGAAYRDGDQGFPCASTSGAGGGGGGDPRVGQDPLLALRSCILRTSATAAAVVATAGRPSGVVPASAGAVVHGDGLRTTANRVGRASAEAAAAVAAAAAASRRLPRVSEPSSSDSGSGWDSGSCTTSSTGTSTAAETDVEGGSMDHADIGAALAERRHSDQRPASDNGLQGSGKGHEAATGADGASERSGEFVGVGKHENGGDGRSTSSSDGDGAALNRRKSSGSSSSSSGSSSSSSSSEPDDVRGDSESSSSRSSSQRAKGNSSNDSDDSDSGQDPATLGGKPPEQRRTRPGVQPASAGGPQTQADLFSELDRLFLAGGRSAPHGLRAAGIAVGAALRGRGHGRAEGPGGSKATATAGKGGFGTSAAATGPSAGSRVDAALRARVLERLKLVAGGPPPQLPQPPPRPQQSRGNASIVAPARGTTTEQGPARPQQSRLPQPVGAGTALEGRAVGGGSTVLHRPTLELPLGYLLWLKPTRQALLVVHAPDGAAADALAAHPLTELLLAAPPGLLMATVHLTPAAVVRRTSYRSWVRHLPGPHVWCGNRGTGEGPATVGDAAGATKARVGGCEGGATQAGGSAAEEASGKPGNSMLELGHLGACLVTTRLNAVAPAIFPLPFGLRRGASAAGGRADRELAAAITAAVAPLPALPTLLAHPAAGGMLPLPLTQPPSAGAQQAALNLLDSQEVEEGHQGLGEGDVPLRGQWGRGEAQEPRLPSRDALTGSGADEHAAAGRGEDAPPVAAVSDGCRTAAATAPSAVHLPHHLVASLLASLTSTLTLTAAGRDGPSGSRRRRQGKAAAAVTAVTSTWDGGLGSAGAVASAAGPGCRAGASLARAATGTAAEAEAGALLLAGVGALQRSLLEERRSSGLAQMLMALRAACPALTRSAEADRLLCMQPGPRPQPHATNLQHPQQALMQPGTLLQPLLPQELYLLYPRPATQQQRPDQPQQRPSHQQLPEQLDPGQPRGRVPQQVTHPQGCESGAFPRGQQPQQQHQQLPPHPLPQQTGEQRTRGSINQQQQQQHWRPHCKGLWPRGGVGSIPGSQPTVPSAPPPPPPPPVANRLSPWPGASQTGRWVWVPAPGQPGTYLSEAEARAELAAAAASYGIKDSGGAVMRPSYDMYPPSRTATDPQVIGTDGWHANGNVNLYPNGNGLNAHQAARPYNGQDGQVTLPYGGVAHGGWGSASWAPYRQPPPPPPPVFAGFQTHPQGWSSQTPGGPHPQHSAQQLQPIHPHRQPHAPGAPAHRQPHAPGAPAAWGWPRPDHSSGSGAPPSARPPKDGTLYDNTHNGTGSDTRQSAPALAPAHASHTTAVRAADGGDGDGEGAAAPTALASSTADNRYVASRLRALLRQPPTVAVAAEELTETALRKPGFGPDSGVGVASIGRVPAMRRGADNGGEGGGNGGEGGGNSGNSNREVARRVRRRLLSGSSATATPTGAAAAALAEPRPDLQTTSAATAAAAAATDTAPTISVPTSGLFADAGRMVELQAAPRTAAAVATAASTAPAPAAAGAAGVDAAADAPGRAAYYQGDSDGGCGEPPASDAANRRAAQRLRAVLLSQRAGCGGGGGTGVLRRTGTAASSAAATAAAAAGLRQPAVVPMTAAEEASEGTGAPSSEPPVRAPWAAAAASEGAARAEGAVAAVAAEGGARGGRTVRQGPDEASGGFVGNAGGGVVPRGSQLTEVAAAAVRAYEKELALYGAQRTSAGAAGAVNGALAAEGAEEEPPSCLLLCGHGAAATAAVPSSSATGPPPHSSPAVDVSVLFLGTGSAEPSKYRGASAVLVRNVGPTRGSLLIDAGEGAFGAMVRWLGRKGALAQAAALSLVWLSHKHPDHVLGLPALLEARPPGGPPLLVVGPKEVGQWLSKVAPLHPGWSFTFLHCADFSGAPTALSDGPATNSTMAAAPGGSAAASPRPGQICYCCPPYSGHVVPYGAKPLWPQGYDMGDGGLEPLAPLQQAMAAAAPDPPGGPSATRVGARSLPGPAARLRWHQRRRTLAAARTAPQPNDVQQPHPQQPQQSQDRQRQWQQQVAVSRCTALGLVRWQSVAVHHCRDAWGLVLEHADGWKLVYSGDTRPCPTLVSAGRGATLLIHEATFEPCLDFQARSKRHSTSAEAAAVANAMGAYRTVLTHFSQRYPRIPAGIEPWALPLRRRPVPAFDGMLLPLSALPALPLIMPPLAVALADPP